jgi:thioester reductase-like protein
MPSGKLDRQALANRAIDAPAATSYAPPETDVECTVAAIWADVLKLERVGRHDSFFDLGGHSLLAAQLLARIESQFSKPLSLRRLFESPTVAGIAAAIEAPDSIATLPAALRKDAILDPTIRPGNSSPASEITSIFVTGATGFLGAHLLAGLLRSSSAVIYCLVRADNQDHARSRLRQSLERYELWEQSFSKRLMPIVGDLAKPRLGLSESDFAQLSASIDAIYHCGAGVSAVQPYASLRAANVLGTIQILKLACHGPPKSLHHISTLAVWASPAYTGRTQIAEDDAPTDCEGLDGGYTQSKWVAERLVLEARARGLPVSIYRPGLVTGHSVTGICKSDDLTLAAARLCIEFKILPRLDISLDLLPVDYLARAIIHLSRKRGQAHRTYHLFNPHPMSWTRFGEWLQRQGYDLNFISLNELEHLTARIGEDRGLLTPFKLLFSSERTSDSTPHTQIDDQNVRDALGDMAFTCPAVGESLLRVYLAYFTQSGLLNASGIAAFETP